jgi:putative transposase
LKDSSIDQGALSWSSIITAPLQWKNSPETLLPLTEPSEEAEVMRARRILLKPSAVQKSEFRNWFGTYRFVFNKVIDFKEEEYLATGRPKLYSQGRKEWKQRLVAESPWISDTPAHTVYGAMMAADNAYRSMVRKRTKGLVSKLPRCKKKTQKSCYILGNGVSERGVYTGLIGKMKSAEPLPNKPCDSRLVHDSDGRWYLQIPYEVKTTNTENQGVCALDPGVRTFLTGASSNGALKIGKGAFGRIVRLCKHLDALVSKAARTKKKSVRRAVGRARVRIRDLIDDLHFQSIGYLTRTFKTIVFPEANFTSAVAKATRRIGSRSARSLMTFAFARFRDRLIAKAEVVGVNVITVCEAYTSKTANWTGEIVHNLGGAKTITSKGIRLDRDLNAALGILLKALPNRPCSGTTTACTSSLSGSR